MEDLRIADIEFKTWAETARTDPETFEELRQQAIDDFINSVPEENRERLRRLQWRIDQERRLAKTPMAACLRISRMMWRNVLGEGGIRERLEQLSGLLHGQPQSDLTAGRQISTSAEIVAFARARD